MGRERNIKSYSKRGKSGKILFKTSGWVIFGQREEHKNSIKRRQIRKKFDTKYPVEGSFNLPGMKRGIINKNRDNGGLSEDFSPGNHIKSG